MDGQNQQDLPSWFNRRGLDMNVCHVDPRGWTASFENNQGGRLWIGNGASLNDLEPTDRWRMKWAFGDTQLGGFKTLEGEVSSLSTPELLLMFGLLGELAEYYEYTGVEPIAPVSPSGWLPAMYPVDRAIQGKFVGLGPLVNIPHPGMGVDGDPNISLDLSLQNQMAVRAIVRPLLDKLRRRAVLLS